MALPAAQAPAAAATEAVPPAAAAEAAPLTQGCDPDEEPTTLGVVTEGTAGEIEGNGTSGDHVNGKQAK